MNDYGLMGGFGMGFGWIIPVLFIFLLVYFIDKLLKKDASAKDILDERYAKGEIDEEEYETKKRSLQS